MTSQSPDGPSTTETSGTGASWELITHQYLFWEYWSDRVLHNLHSDATTDADLPKKVKREENVGRRCVRVNDLSPEAACESQSGGLSDCTLHAS